MGFLDKLSDKITGANIPPPPPSNDWFEDPDEQDMEKDKNNSANSAPRPPKPEDYDMGKREIPASAESYLSGDVFTVKFITADDTHYGGEGRVDISGTVQVRLTAESMHRTAASSRIRQEMIAQSRQTMVNMCENGVPFDLLKDHSKMAALAITNRFESEDFELVNVTVQIETSAN